MPTIKKITHYILLIMFLSIFYTTSAMQKPSYPVGAGLYRIIANLQGQTPTKKRVSFKLPNETFEESTPYRERPSTDSTPQHSPQDRVEELATLFETITLSGTSLEDDEEDLEPRKTTPQPTPLMSKYYLKQHPLYQCMSQDERTFMSNDETLCINRQTLIVKNESCTALQIMNRVSGLEYSNNLEALLDFVNAWLVADYAENVITITFCGISDEDIINTLIKYENLKHVTFLGCRISKNTIRTLAQMHGQTLRVINFGKWTQAANDISRKDFPSLQTVTWKT